MKDLVYAAVEALMMDEDILDGLIHVLVEDRKIANIVKQAKRPKKFVSQAEREDRIHSAQLLALAYNAKKALAARVKAQRYA